MALYLIKRGPKPDHHTAPFHPVIVTEKKSVALWQAGNTRSHSWVWTKERDAHSGWLLVRWCGLDIDYKPVVAGERCPMGRRWGSIIEAIILRPGRSSLAPSGGVLTRCLPGPPCVAW